jgi:hypothetical protein
VCVCVCVCVGACVCPNILPAIKIVYILPILTLDHWGAKMKMNTKPRSILQTAFVQFHGEHFLTE